MYKWFLLFFIFPDMVFADSWNVFSVSNVRQQVLNPSIDIQLINSSNDIDELKVRFQENADVAFDEADSIDLENAPINISAFSTDDIALSINTIPLHLVRLNIPLNVTSDDFEVYRLEWKLSDMLNYRVILKDDYTDELIDLDTSAGYDFEITSDPLTSGKDRFQLILTQRVHFTVESQTADAGQLIEVPVSVLNFKEILTAQFAILWDVQTLSFQKADQFAISSMNSAHFNIDTTAGRLIFAWDDSGLNPQTLAEDDTLFLLHFMISGSHGDIGDIAFDDKSIVPEVAGSDFKAVSTQFNDGKIDVVSIKNIKGQVTDLDGEPIADLTVLTEGDTVMQTTTDSEGYFELDFFKVHYPKISVQQGDPGNMQLMDGINSADIVHISRHLLDISKFENEALAKAADVDESGSLDTSDISLLRQLVLGEDVNLSPGNLYQFYSNQNSMTEIMVNDSVEFYNFTGVKLGDIDNSWADSGIEAGDREMGLHIDNSQALQDEEIRIPVIVEEFNKIAAFQFTLEWDPELVKYKGIESVAVEVQLNESLVANGYLPVQWDPADAQSLSLPEGATLFYLKFAVTGSPGSASDIKINSHITEKRAFDDLLQDVKITTTATAQIKIVEEIVSSIGDIHKNPRISNYPNPFHNTTILTFDMDRSNYVSILIMDSQGRRIKKTSRYYQAGSHEVLLDLADNCPPGIIYLHLMIGKRRQAIKLIKKP